MVVTAKDKRENLLKKELNRIVKILKDKYCPEKIILFGSLAEGQVHEWSDVDLLIIKETNKRPIERCLEVARLVKPKLGIDLFIYTPEEYNTILKEGFSFIKDIEKHCRILYEKRDRTVA